MDKYAKFVGTKLRLLWMGNHLLPATNVLSLFADHAMSMREEKEIKLALSAKLDTSESKASLFSCFQGMNAIIRLIY